MSARCLRYAVLDRRPSGLNRELRNLRWLLADAHLPGRVADLPALNLYPREVALGRWRALRAWLPPRAPVTVWLQPSRRVLALRRRRGAWDG